MEKEINKREEKLDMESKGNGESDIKLGSEQEKMKDIMEYSMDNLLIIGKGGVGKSLLLDRFRNDTTKKVVVLAPTGIAALNVRGQTIHSFFRFDIGLQTKEKIEDSIYVHTPKVLKTLDTIIIDEVSMLRPDILDAINIICQYAKKSIQPFGGIQMIFFGDLLQLPPVITDEEVFRYIIDTYKGTLFFNANTFKNGDFNIYELNHVYRQNDLEFIDILNNIRIGNVSKKILDKINERVMEPQKDTAIINLTTTRNEAESLNQRKLSCLTTPLYRYNALAEGNFNKTTYPTEFQLELKVGSQVIMVANDSKGRWVNGTLAEITSLSEEEIKVKIRGVEYEVDKYTWPKIKFEYDEITKKPIEIIDGKFTQYPVKLAWAMTIHKSQSKTYDSVLIDFGDGAFEYGQAYVALSRCRSMDKLFLKREILPNDIKVNPEIISFMKEADIKSLA